jgi:hypothetical protein
VGPKRPSCTGLGCPTRKVERREKRVEKHKGSGSDRRSHPKDAARTENSETIEAQTKRRNTDLPECDNDPVLLIVVQRPKVENREVNVGGVDRASSARTVRKSGESRA